MIKKHPIFRPEAIEHSFHHWLGSPQVITPVGASIWVMLALAPIIGLIAFLVAGDYTQRVTLIGSVIHHPAVARITPSHDGIIVSSFAAEGKMVRAGEVIFIVNMETQTANGGTKHQITSALESQKITIEREIKLKSEAADTEQNFLAQNLKNKEIELQKMDSLLAQSTQQTSWLLEKAEHFKKLVRQGIALETEHMSRRSEYHNASIQLAAFQREKVKLQGEVISIKARLAAIRNELEASLEMLRRQTARLDQDLVSAEERRELHITSPINGTVIIGLFFLMWAYNGQLVVIVVLISILYAAIKFFLFGAYRSANLEAIAHEAKQQSHFLETVRGIACVKIFDLAERRRSDWLNLVIDEANAKAYLFKIDLATQTIGLLLIGLSSAITLWLGAKLIDEGTVTTGMLFAFLIYSDIYVTRTIRVIDSIIKLRLINMHSERLSDVALAIPERETGEINAMTANTSAGSIEVKGLSYRYGDDEPAVFENVFLSIKAGESIAIIGPSGCGKSTLLKIMGGLAPQESGSILLDGVDGRRLGLGVYRKSIAYVLQEDRLFAGSLLDNISSFDIHPEIEWVFECARLASIHTEIEAMPMKYETMVGDMGNALSGGQRQRISLARALYKRPRILFLDEATSDLDIDNETRINDSIRALNITRVFIAHRPTMIAMADRVFDLSKNAEMEKDNPHAFFIQ